MTDCSANEFGISPIIGGLGIGAGLPIIPYGGGVEAARSTGATSLASKFLSSNALGRQTFSKVTFGLINRVWAPTIANPRAYTATVGRALGRWTPIMGAGLLAYDAYSIGQCTVNCASQGFRP